VSKVAKKNKKKPQQPKQKKVAQYLFRVDRVEAKEKEGWKRIKGAINPKHPITHAEDLVLMEKNV